MPRSNAVKKPTHPVIAGIRINAKIHPQKAALRCSDGEYSYPALVAMMDARARVLQMQGARKEDVVILTAERGVSSVVDILALWALGASVIPVRSGMDPRDIRDLQLLAGAASHLLVGTTLRSFPEHETTTATASSIAFGSSEALQPLCYFSAKALGQSILKYGISYDLSRRTVLGFSALNDQASILELWIVLGSGGTVEMVTAEEAGTREGFLHSLCFSHVDFIHATESLLQALRGASASSGVLAHVKNIAVAASTITCKPALRKLFPAAWLHNFDW